MDEFLQAVNHPFLHLGDTPVSLMTLAQVLIVVCLAVVAARLVRSTLLGRILGRTRLDPGQQYALARVAGYLVTATGLLIGLETIGLELTSLTVMVGALGVGIGFGLQNIVNNFVSGLILLFERPFQIGHRVDVGGTTGQVTDIGARSTTIITNDNIAIVVPNSKFIQEEVINWSLSGDRRVRFRLPVGVGYGSEPREVERVLLEVAAGNPDTLKDPPPAVVFMGFGESSIDFELRVWTSTLFDRPNTLKSALYFSIWDRFKALHIEIPFPQRDVHLKGPVVLSGPRES